MKNLTRKIAPGLWECGNCKGNAGMFPGANSQTLYHEPFDKEHPKADAFGSKCTRPPKKTYYQCGTCGGFIEGSDSQSSDFPVFVGELWPDNKCACRLECVHIVFDGPPSHESGRFIEVETPDGKGLRFGEWVKRDDGYWALVIPLNNPPMLNT